MNSDMLYTAVASTACLHVSLGICASPTAWNGVGVAAVHPQGSVALEMGTASAAAVPRVEAPEISTANGKTHGTNERSSGESSQGTGTSNSNGAADNGNGQVVMVAPAVVGNGAGNGKAVGGGGGGGVASGSFFAAKGSASGGPPGMVVSPSMAALQVGCRVYLYCVILQRLGHGGGQKWPPQSRRTAMPVATCSLFCRRVAPRVLRPWPLLVPHMPPTTGVHRHLLLAALHAHHAGVPGPQVSAGCTFSDRRGCRTSIPASWKGICELAVATWPVLVAAPGCFVTKVEFEAWGRSRVPG